MIALTHQPIPTHFSVPIIRRSGAFGQIAAELGRLLVSGLQISAQATDASYAVSKDGRLVLASRRSPAAQPDSLF